MAEFQSHQFTLECFNRLAKADELKDLHAKNLLIQKLEKNIPSKM